MLAPPATRQLRFGPAAWSFRRGQACPRTTARWPPKTTLILLPSPPYFELVVIVVAFIYPPFSRVRHHHRRRRRRRRRRRPQNPEARSAAIRRCRSMGSVLHVSSTCREPRFHSTLHRHRLRCAGRRVFPRALLEQGGASEGEQARASEASDSPIVAVASPACCRATLITAFTILLVAPRGSSARQKVS